MPGPSLLQRLKERKLVQWAIAYLAGAFVVFQAVEVMAEPWGISPAVQRAVHIVLVFGLLITLVLAWYHGEKGLQKVARTEIALLSILLMLAVAATGLTMTLNPGTDDGRSAAVSSPGLDLRRVAVLYFKDLSDGGRLQHLADGLAEGLIEELRQVSGLSVVSRNGVGQFRGTDLDRDSIAALLGAGTLLEGSVESRGEEIQVTLRLFDGASGTPRRDRVLERPAEDPLAIRRELPGEVALLLREWLGEEVQLRRYEEGTEHVGAWSLLQRGEKARKDGEAALAAGHGEGLEAGFKVADSLLAEAEELDPRWVEPVILRAKLALRLANFSSGDPLEARRWIDAGMDLADQAIAMAPREASALGLRGQLKCLRWVLGLARDPVEAERLLRSAEEDLETATRWDGSLAEGYLTLARVRAQNNDNIGAKLAARQAYEADAFLTSAQDVFWILYTTSYDLEHFPDAVQYCEEGRRRFPAAPFFTECQLWLLASRALEPDPDRAWQLVDSLVALSNPRTREFNRRMGQIIVGGVLARANLPDSARRVFKASRPTPAVDPGQFLLGVEAIFRLQMGETEEALDLLRVYLTTSPEHRSGYRWTSHWWWRDLHSNPEFMALVGSRG
jgi:serine/threonine-protein kinase